MSRLGVPDLKAMWPQHPQHNNGMHPTRTSAALNIKGSSGRVMPGVNPPERDGMRTREFHPVALRAV